MNSLGQRIKARRLELKWTQDELAKRAGISTSFLSDLENKKRSVSAETLLDLARVLSLSLDYLMKGEGETPQQTEEVQIPASLAEFAKKENISFVQALMLLDMQRQIVAHRRSPESDDLQTVNWRKFYESMKEFL
jgi:transcriptional regulator with XRE-family HTH domain